MYFKCEWVQGRKFDFFYDEEFTELVLSMMPRKPKKKRIYNKVFKNTANLIISAAITIAIKEYDESNS